MTGDTRYKKGTIGESHMNVGLLNGQDGDLFAGEPFPVLWQKKFFKNSTAPIAK